MLQAQQLMLLGQQLVLQGWQLVLLAQQHKICRGARKKGKGGGEIFAGFGRKLRRASGFCRLLNPLLLSRL